MTRYKKTSQLSWLVFLLLIGILLRTTLSNASTNTYAFLKIPNGARAIGLGSSFVAIADDGTTTYWNPAGLGTLRQREIHFMYTAISPNPFAEKSDIGSRYHYISVVYPRLLGQVGGLGFTFIRLSIDQIERTGIDKFGELIREGQFFENTETALILSYGLEVIKNMISAGVNAKLMNHNLDQIEGRGYGIDIGGLADLSAIFGTRDKKSLWFFQHIRLGVAIQSNFQKKWNVAFSAKSGGKSSEFQTDPGLLSGQYGISFEPNIGDVRWLLSATIDQARGHPLKLAVGTEFQLEPMTGFFFAIRAGMSNQYLETRQEGLSLEQLNENRFFTMGGGIQYDSVAGNYALDYALELAKLASHHRFSLAIRF